MTFGSGGGSPKTIQMLTDTAPVVQSFSNREFYTCPLDTLAILTPILFSYGSGSASDPETYNFGGINIKHIDPITAAVVSFQTQYGGISALPFGSPHYGRVFLDPNTPDVAAGAGNGLFPQRYEKYTSVYDSLANAIKAFGGGIILFPGEVARWGASNGYSNPTNWKLRYGLVEYGISE